MRIEEKDEAERILKETVEDHQCQLSSTPLLHWAVEQPQKTATMVLCPPSTQWISNFSSSFLITQKCLPYFPLILVPPPYFRVLLKVFSPTQKSSLGSFVSMNYTTIAPQDQYRANLYPNTGPLIRALQ